MPLPARLRSRIALPVMAAPMFLVSGPELAAACCKAGIVGSLTRNHCRDDEELEAQLRNVTDALTRHAGENSQALIGPLAVNISPNSGSAVFRAQIELCRRYGVEIIVTSVGDPTANAPLVRDAGILHFHDATSIRFAEKAASAGVDGIVCIGAGGGGHSGTISPFAFVPQVRAMFDGIVLMAGAISTGAGVRAAEVMGADLAYIGTRFIATKESHAPNVYKEMLVRGGVNDVIYTSAVNGMAANWLKESLREAGLDSDNLGPAPTGHASDFLPNGKRPWRDIWSAGQGIGSIHDIPEVTELIQRLQTEYAAACR